MTTIREEGITLADIASRSETNKGDITKDIVELLSKENDIFDDMKWIPGNMAHGHKYTVRTGLPKATWTKLYKGVPTTKSTTAQVVETFGRLEAASQIDTRIYDQVKNPDALRNSEDVAVREALYQELARAIFYENQQTNESSITGLTPRYNDGTAENKANIISGGGTGNALRSIWLIGWGQNGTFGIYPDGKDGVAGLTMKNKKDVDVADADGNNYEVDMTKFKWNCGLCVKDWRKTARIANLDLTDANPPDLSDLMDLALDAIIAPSAVSLAFYMTRKTFTLLKQQVKKRQNVYFKTEMEFMNRQRVATYLQVPIRIVDALDVNESAVVLS